MSANCGRCKRALKDPASVKRGYGKICWAKVQENKDGDTMREFHDIYVNEPMDEFVILERRNGEVVTNVPHVVTHHSPDGYEYGYMGSGCADLALNILENVLRGIGYQGEKTNSVWSKQYIFRLSYRLHQPFKQEFIAPVDRERGAHIYTNDIIRWIETQKKVYEIE